MKICFSIILEKKKEDLRDEIVKGNLEEVKDMFEWFDLVDSALCSADEGERSKFTTLSEKDKFEILVTAVQSKRVNIAQFLIDKGYKVKIKNSDGTTPLHIATRNGDIEMVKLLLSAGANINALERYSYSPLHEAIEKQDEKLIDLFLNNGASINFKCFAKAIKIGNVPLIEKLRKSEDYIKTTKGYCKQFLVLAVDAENIELVNLLKNDVEKTDYCDSLNKAIEKGNVEILKILLENGANVNSERPYGTSLHLAARKANLEIMRLLLEKDGDVNAVDKENWTPLHEAAKAGHADIVQILLDNGACVNSMTRCGGLTALSIAAKHASVKTVELLLNRGAKINHSFQCATEEHSPMKNLTPLHFACENPDEKVFDCLINRGALVNPDIRVNRSYVKYTTVLHYAAKHSKTKFIEKLLQLGANLHAQDEWGRTALHYAAQHGPYKAAKVLLEAGSCVTDGDNKDLTSLDCAALSFGLSAEHSEKEVFDMLQLLSNNGDFGTYKATNSALSFALSLAADSGNYKAVKFLLIRGTPVTTVQREGITTHPLSLSSGKGFKPIVELLLSRGVNINLKDSTNRMTAIHHAALNGQSDMVIYLLEKGADVNIKSKSDMTSLHYAARGREEEIVRLLLPQINDIDATDVNGRTALFHAFDSRYKCENIALTLINNGANFNIKDKNGQTILHNLQTINGSSEAYSFIKIMAMMRSNVEVSDDILRLINSDDSWKVYFERCQEELVSWKQTKFDNITVTAYDILLAKTTKQLVGYSRNKSIVNYMEKLGTKEIPYHLLYKLMIQENIKKGWLRQRLLDHHKVRSFLNRIYDNDDAKLPSLPNICVEKILGYLRLGDLSILKWL